MSLRLQDPTLSASTWVSANLFTKNLDLMPTIQNVGDIILIKDAKVSHSTLMDKVTRFNNKPQLMGMKDQSTYCTFLSSNTITKEVADTPTMQIVYALQQFCGKVPSIPSTVTVGRPTLEIHQVKDSNTFFDLYAEVNAVKVNLNVP
jgi:hypothetical protein